MSPRERLLFRIFELGFRTPDWSHDVAPPIVALEDFFEGNTQPESIAVGLEPHPGLSFFHTKLIEIRSRADVQDVLVNIYDLTDIVYDPENGWPYSENTHILTSAPESLVQAWADELLSDGAGEGWPYGEPTTAPKPLKGYRWWWLSWD